MAAGAIINALFDLLIKLLNKPFWIILANLEPATFTGLANGIETVRRAAQIKTRSETGSAEAVYENLSAIRVLDRGWNRT